MTHRPDYYYEPRPRAAIGTSWDLRSITVWLIILNVAIFAIDRLVPLYMIQMTPQGPLPMRLLTALGHFSAALAIDHLQVWRFISFQFLHANLTHLFFNMIGLYFFGPMIEGYLGRRRFIAFYLLCGIAGAATYLLLLWWNVVNVQAFTPLVGASAGIFGILMAAARIAPNARVMLLFPPIPLRLRTLAWILMAIAALAILTRAQNAGGEAAHLGGAVLGLVLIQFPQVLSVLTLSFGRRR
jgi:membrane associated rhomboid family serine protease